jgi:hypothetical protein
MKGILLVVALGLITGAMYASGGFSALVNKMTPLNLKTKKVDKKATTGNVPNQSSISKSYVYEDTERVNW